MIFVKSAKNQNQWTWFECFDGATVELHVLEHERGNLAEVHPRESQTSRFRR